MSVRRGFSRSAGAPHCDREMPITEIVKGFEFEKGRYVVVNDEDIQKVRVESTRVIDLVQFTEDTAIDPIYVDKAYYLAPDGAMGADAFAVMREGMAGKAGIGKLALYGREYLVAVRPQKKGLVMYTLHHDAEIRGIDQIEELNSVPSKVKPEEMKLAKQVIATFDSDLNLKDYKDEYKEGLRKIIDAKIAGEEVVATEVQEPPKVVDLMEALRRSLDAVSTDKKKPAKADLSRARSKSKAKSSRAERSAERWQQGSVAERASRQFDERAPDQVNWPRYVATAIHLASAAWRDGRLPCSPRRWLIDLRHLHGLMSSGRPTPSIAEAPSRLAARIPPSRRRIVVHEHRLALAAFLAAGNRLRFEPTAVPPRVSVLLVLFNRAELTFRCLRSVLESHACVARDRHRRQQLDRRDAVCCWNVWMACASSAPRKTSDF